MAKQTFMSRVKAYRKLHPRCSQVDAMKKLKGTTVSGTKRKKPVATGSRRGNSTGPSTVHTGTLTISGHKKAVKKPATKTIRITSVGSARKPVSKGDTLLKRGMAIVTTINRLEARYKTTKDKAAKRLLATVINAEHDKLDRIQKQAKLKSA